MENTHEEIPKQDVLFFTAKKEEPENLGQQGESAQEPDSDLEKSTNLEEPAKETQAEKTQPEQEEKNQEPAKKEDKPKDQNPDKSTKEKESEPIKIDFGAPKTQEAETAKSTENKQEAVSVTEESVRAFLESQGVKVGEKLTDLSQKVTLNEEVEKFQKYNEETGRGLKDFYSLQKDWGAEDKDATIKEYLKLQNPESADETINTQLDLLRITEDDKDSLSERELKQMEVDYNNMYSKALKFMNDKSKEYQLPLENKSQPYTTPTPEEIAKAHQPYWDARSNSMKNIEEMSFKVEGLGEIKLSVDDQDKQLINSRTETAESFVNRWKNKDETMNTDKLVQDVLWSNEESRQKLITSIIEQSQALFLDRFSKENRNVELDKPQKGNKGKQDTGARLDVISDSTEGVKQGNFGKPLIPKIK